MDAGRALLRALQEEAEAEYPGAGPMSPRPWWMTALALACGAALAINLVSDLFVPASRYVEVWFGFEVTGRLALVTAPLHWTLFGIGAWACWTRQPWAVPAVAGYLFYVAFSHLVWSEVSENGRGWPVGLAQAICIAGSGYLLLRMRERQQRLEASGEGG